MNIFTSTFSGNLTDQATKTDLVEKEKTVYSFTVACNIDKNNTTFLECNYWTKLNNNTPESGVKTLLDLLKKGTSVTVVSNYLKSSKSTNEETNREYNNMTFIVSKIDIH